MGDKSGGGRWFYLQSYFNQNQRSQQSSTDNYIMHTNLRTYSGAVCAFLHCLFGLCRHPSMPKISRTSVEFYYYRLIKIKAKRKTESTGIEQTPIVVCVYTLLCMPLSTLYLCLYIHEPVAQVTSYELFFQRCACVCARRPHLRRTGQTSSQPFHTIIRFKRNRTGLFLR